MSNSKNIKFDWDSSRRIGLMSGTFFKEIRNMMSIPNDGAKFARFRTNQYVQQRLYAITPTGRFDPCLYYDIKRLLKERDIKISINKTEEFIKQIHPRYNISPKCNLNLELRDYQEDIVKNCLSVGRGSIILATAGGKTLTIASLIENIHQNSNNIKCLVIVPDLMLVNQTYNDFKEYGVSFNYSKWTGKHELDISSNVIIANTGILLSSKTDTSWINHIDLLIVDEVHKARKNNKINKLVKSIRTPHKFGFTGTMPENLMDQWNIT